MSSEHRHTLPGATDDRQRYMRALLGALALALVFLVIEIVAGLLTNSLALVSDAAHMFADVVGLAMAAAAVYFARRGGRDPQKTFGLYRLEIIAALANVVLLFAAATYIVIEAIARFRQPPEVLGAPMLAVAAAGLCVNVLMLVMLRRAAGESLNVEGAYLEVFADLLGSVGAIVAALVIQTTGFVLVDPIVAVLVGAFVLPRSVRLGWKALRVLMQAAPEATDVNDVRQALESIEGVVGVHDLHLWTLTIGMDVCSVHLCIDEAAQERAVLRHARDTLASRFALVHSTIQVEHIALGECAQGDGGAHAW